MAVKFRHLGLNDFCGCWCFNLFYICFLMHSLLEKMPEWAVTENRDLKSQIHAENANRLLHIVQDFLQSEGYITPSLWTEKVCHSKKKFPFLQICFLFVNVSKVSQVNWIFLFMCCLLKLLEEIVTLMDSLSVWYPAGLESETLSQVEFRLLLGFIAQDNLQVGITQLFSKYIF